MSFDPERPTAQAARLAANQSTFRAANGSIADKAAALDAADVALPFICECSRPECTAITRLTLAEYENVRAHPRRFFVVEGHECEDEKVIARSQSFVIVEKSGFAGRIATQLEDDRLG